MTTGLEIRRAMVDIRRPGPGIWLGGRKRHMPLIRFLYDKEHKKTASGTTTVNRI